MKLILKLFVTVVIFTATVTIGDAQTPYDSYVLSNKNREMLRLPESTYRAENKDTLGEVRFIELDKESLLLKCYGKDGLLVNQVQLEPGNFKWESMDPLSNKYPSFSPYNYVANSPLINKDPDGKDIIVTTKQGNALFILNDGKTQITIVTASDLYKQKIQWFEPQADNYMPMKAIADGIEKSSELKHFTWNQVAEFADEDRWMISYRQGGSGDWKKSEEGADGYLMVTVDGKPYWADAVGQIPFAVNSFKDNLVETRDANKSIQLTMESGKKYGEGKLFGGVPDNSNTYDNYFIFRGLKYAAEKYKCGIFGLDDNKLYKTDYSPNNLGTSISGGDAVNFGIK